MNKRKIFLITLLYLIGFLIQILGISLFDTIDFKFAIIICFASAIPIAILLLTTSSLLSKELKVLKYILNLYAIIIILSFLIICILAIFTNFDIENLVIIEWGQSSQ